MSQREINRKENLIVATCLQELFPWGKWKFKNLDDQEIKSALFHACAAAFQNSHKPKYSLDTLLTTAGMSRIKTMFRNKLNDIYNARKKRRNIDSEMPPSVKLTEAEMEVTTEEHEDYLRWEVLMKKKLKEHLNPRHFSLYTKFYDEGKSLSVIAAEMETNENSAGQLHHRVKARIQKLFESGKLPPPPV